MKTGILAIVGMSLLGILLEASPAAAKDTAATNNACWIEPMNANPEKEFDPSVLRSLRSAEEVPNVLGDLRDHWALMYDTGSPQTHDYRVISYSPKAQAIVAYTGCPEEKDGKPVAYPKEAYPPCEQVEVLRFRSPEEKIELLAYQLPGKGRDPKQYPVRVIGPNAGECTSCHGDPPNARWEPYNSWPGAFGSISREGEDVMRQGSPEHKKYQDFVARVFANPDGYRRYSQLTWRLGDPTLPQELKPEQLQYYLDKGEIPVRTQHSSTPQPNPELNKMLSEWRGRMILKTLSDASSYSQMRYAMLAVAMGCPTVLSGNEDKPWPVTKFLPPNLAKQNYESLKKEIVQTLDQEHRLNATEVKKQNAFDSGGRYRIVSTPSDRIDNQMYDLAYLWRLAGQDFANWNTTSNQRFNFNEGRSALGPIFHAFWQYNDRCDNELKAYSKYLQYDPFAGVTARDTLSEQELKAACQEVAAKGRQSTHIAKATDGAGEMDGTESSNSPKKHQARDRSISSEPDALAP